MIKRIIITLFIWSQFVTSCTKEKIVEVKYVPNEIEYAGFQNDFLDEVNMLRNENNRPSLRAEKLLTFGATSHANYMAYNNDINHDYFWDRYMNSNATLFGECCAYNFETASNTISGFESSSPHMQVLLGNYTHCGIAKVGEYMCINLANYNDSDANRVVSSEIIIDNISSKQVR